MSFIKKQWNARQGVGLNKFSIDGKLAVTLVNMPDSVISPGDAFSEENMNNLENRIGEEFENIARAMNPINQVSSEIHLSPTSAGYVDKLIMNSEPNQIISPNLIKQPYSEGSKTFGGITFTVNPDFSIKINGIPTTYIMFRLCSITLPSGTYSKTYLIQNQVQVVYLNKNQQTGESMYFFGNTLTLKRDTLIDIYLQVDPKFVPNNVTISPMLNLGATLLPYQPYTGQPIPENAVPIKVASSPINITSEGANLIIPFDVSRTCSGLTLSTIDKYNGLYQISGICTHGGENPRYYEFTNSFNKSVTFRIKLIGTYHYGYYYLNSTYGELRLSSGKIKTVIIPPKATFALGLASVDGNDWGNSIFQIDILNGTYLNADTLPYLPYQVPITTQIPLITSSDNTVELLGEYNTETNLLEQKWAKLIVDNKYGIDYREDWSSENMAVFIIKRFGIYTKPIMTKNGHCNRFKKVEDIWALRRLEEPSFTFEPMSAPPYMGIKISRTIASDIDTLNTWLAANPIEVYYELATPNILTLKESPPVPTLDGETTIFANDNLSPITFDVTELLVRKERINGVLEDKNKNAIMPFTTAEQVEINRETGKTLDMELESVEAGISDINLRLLKLGFKLGSVSLSTGITATLNNIKRQGNYVLCELGIDNRFTINSIGGIEEKTINIGQLPSDFLPLKNETLPIFFTAQSVMLNVSKQHYATSYAYLEIDTNGNVILHIVSSFEDVVGDTSFVFGETKFGYEATPIA